MRESVHRAAARRDDRLARIRKLSLWITGGAAAASLGLGTAFAHALPGHATTTGNASSTSTVTGSGTRNAAGAAKSAGSGRAVSPAASPSAISSARPAASSTSHKPATRSSHKLAAPASTPAPTQQAPVVQSGGS